MPTTLVPSHRLGQPASASQARRQASQQQQSASHEPGPNPLETGPTQDAFTPSQPQTASHAGTQYPPRKRKRLDSTELRPSRHPKYEGAPTTDKTDDEIDSSDVRIRNAAKARAYRRKSDLQARETGQLTTADRGRMSHAKRAQEMGVGDSRKDYTRAKRDEYAAKEGFATRQEYQLKILNDLAQKNGFQKGAEYNRAVQERLARERGLGNTANDYMRQLRVNKQAREANEQAAQEALNTLSQAE